MKTKEEIEEEIKRLKAQLQEPWNNGSVVAELHVIDIQGMIQSLEWVLKPSENG